MEVEDDYFDQLVASIETIGVKSISNYQIANNELYQQIELYDKIKLIRPGEIEYIASSIVMDETEINNIETIASEPSSSISNSYRSYAEEQNKDSDIQWIKALIKQHVHTKPKLKDFDTQGLFLT